MSIHARGDVAYERVDERGRDERRLEAPVRQLCHQGFLRRPCAANSARQSITSQLPVATMLWPSVSPAAIPSFLAFGALDVGR